MVGATSDGVVGADAVGIAIIGAGRIAEVHLSNLTSKVRGVRVTGVHDTDAARAASLGERFGVEVVGSLEELFARGSPRGVVIGSSSVAHLDHAKAAVAAGLHVFCEKPLALNEDGIRDAIEVCDQAGRILQVGFNRRFDPNTVAMREEVASGRLGTVRSIHIVSAIPGPRRSTTSAARAVW